MRKLLFTSVALLSAQQALSGGLDRTGQSIDLLFEDGGYAELNFGLVAPELSGTDVLGNTVANVAGSFGVVSGGIKMDVTDKLSLAMLIEEPFGSNVTYGGSQTTTMLGGTSAIASSNSVTALARYKLSDRFSAHGGVRYQTISGDITLSGLAYGGAPGPGSLNGYNVAMRGGDGVGFVAGGAFEIPDIALRVAATYSSAITHKLPTTETVNGIPAFGASADTEIKSPASVNIDFQTGINKKTLLFGSVRYAQWSQLKISPTGFDAAVSPGTSGDSISDLDDSWEASLGLGRALTDKLSASLSVGWEKAGADDLVSPLAPSNGSWSVSLGARYRTDAVTLSGGIRYTKLGDAQPETGTPDVARANFSGNRAISAGMTLGFHF